MFWKFNPQSSPQIDTVLIKEDLTLAEVLDQENLLQELKSQNNKLIEIIIRSDILNQLVSLVTEEPSEELEERERYRLPNLACEVLTTDIPRLNERLSEKEILTKLFSFLENEPPLNPLLASFFSRTLSMLICRKTDQNWYSYQFTCLQVLEFLKSRENSLFLLLQHLGTSAIMDLTLKLITQVEGDEMQNNLFTWLENEAFISNIIALFHPRIDADRHHNASQLLCDTIKKTREMNATPKEQSTTPTNPSNSILNILQSPDTIHKLLGYMLDEGEVTESSIIGGISVLLTLLEPLPLESGSRRGQYKDESGSGEPLVIDNPALPSIVSSITKYLPKLHSLLIYPPKKAPIHLACGIIEPPLGNTRLTIIKLISALIATNTQEVNDALDQLNTVQVLLDLFFHYTWNNFLHSQVDKCLAFALNTPSFEDAENPLISNIFIKCRLLQRILEAWEENESEQGKEGGKRKGYMGHLTNIAISVVRQTHGLADFLAQNIDDNTLISWQYYVENTLKPIDELHSRVLGGKHPSLSNNKNVDTNFKDISFQDGPLQTNYPNFQTIPDNFIQTYLDRDDPAMSQDDIESGRRVDNLVDEYFDRDGSALSQEEDDRSAEIFKKMCFRKDFTEADTSEEEEVYAELPSSPLGNEDASTSSDEDEKIQASNVSKNTDAWGSAIDVAVVNQINPWLQADLADTTANDGWADFSSADIEQQFQAVQLSTSSSQQVSEANAKLEENTFENESSNGVKVSSIDVEPFDHDAKSDNNANLNRLISGDQVDEEKFIDNFRYLSKGMMSEKSDLSRQEDDKNVPISDDSLSGPAESKTNETPKDPV